MEHNTQSKLRKVLKEKCKNKLMHGQYIRNIDRRLISEEDTFLWLSNGDLKVETESEIVWQHKTKRYKRNTTQQKY